MRRGTSGGDDFQVFSPRLARRVGRQKQQCPGIALRSLGQARQRQLGHRGHVGGLGQLEGQAAELRRRAADLRDAALLLFARGQEFRFPATMRDRRRFARCEHVGVVVGRRRRLRRHSPDHRAAIARRNERVGELVNENQLRVADADDVARLQQPVAADHLASHHRAVAAVEVAQHPLPARHEHLGVVSAAPLIFQDDLAGRSAADGDRLTRHQPEDVAPFRALANHQIRQLRHSLALTVCVAKSHTLFSLTRLRGGPQGPR